MEFNPLFDPVRITTRRLVLRPARMRDAKDMYSYSKDPEVARHVLWEAHQSIRETRAVLRRMIRDYHYAPPFTYVIELSGEDRVIGTIGLMTVSRENRSAEVGYSLSRAYWNRGLMTEALTAMLKYCFEELKLNRDRGAARGGKPRQRRGDAPRGHAPRGHAAQAAFQQGTFSGYGAVRHPEGGVSCAGINPGKRAAVIALLCAAVLLLYPAAGTNTPRMKRR